MVSFNNEKGGTRQKRLFIYICIGSETHFICGKMQHFRSMLQIQIYWANIKLVERMVYVGLDIRGVREGRAVNAQLGQYYHLNQRSRITW